MSSFSVEEGLEGSIENFIFRQCPAEFKLKAASPSNGNVPWTEISTPKASLLQISHVKGVIAFPHHEKGKKFAFIYLFIYLFTYVFIV